MKLLGPEHEFTKLIISHKGVDPEDAFSTVPYEKGFHFLWYLDKLVGREHFDKFIPHYFKTWARKSLDSFEFKQTFLDFFNNYGNAEITEKIAQIPWEERFYTPGLPPKPEFDTSYVDSCVALAEKWKQDVSIALIFLIEPDIDCTAGLQTRHQRYRGIHRQPNFGLLANRSGFHSHHFG